MARSRVVLRAGVVDGTGSGLAGLARRVSIWSGPMVLALMLVPDSLGAQSPAEVSSIDSSSLVELSIDEAVSTALERNSRVRSAREGVRRSAAALSSARGTRLPTLSVSGRSTRIDSPIEIDLSPIRDLALNLHPGVPSAAIPPLVTTVQDRDFNNLTLSGTLPLFTGGRISAGVAAAEASLRSSEAAARAAEGAVLTEVVDRYFGVRLAMEARDVHARILDNLRDHLRNTERLESHGMVARAERLRAQVAEAEALREYEDAVRQAELAALALGNVLGMPEGALASTPLMDPIALPVLSEWVNEALASNPRLSQVSAERTRAAQGARAERGQLFPTIAVFGTRELYTSDLTLLDPKWAVGVGFSWTFFQGGQRVRNLEAARALEREVGLLEEGARRDIRLLVESEYRNYESARSRLSSLRATRDLAEESLRAQRVAFEAGLSTSLDVIDAELSLSRVSLGELKARHDAAVALARLQEATGRGDGMVRHLAGGTE